MVIVLSHWHNVSMHTVENKPDIKPGICGPIPLLNHSAVVGGVHGGDGQYMVEAPPGPHQAETLLQPEVGAVLVPGWR